VHEHGLRVLGPAPPPQSPRRAPRRGSWCPPRGEPADRRLVNRERARDRALRLAGGLESLPASSVSPLRRTLPCPNNSRGASSAIFYLLNAGERSHWHKVDAEVWHYSAPGADRAFAVRRRPQDLAPPTAAP
jgi:hypothetical protein